MKRSAASLLCFFALTCAACGSSSGSGSDDNGSDSGGTTEDGSPTDGTMPTTGEDSGQPSTNEDSGQPSSTEDSAAPTTGEDSGSPTSNEDGGTTSDEDGGSPTGEDAGGNENGDAGVDSGEPHDAGTDATTTDHDAGLDAGSEVDASKPVDAGEPDAAKAVDSGTDSGSEEKDAGTDADADAGFDAGVDAGPPPSETLTVTTSGWGIVTASASALSCPTDCTTTYPKGTSVTVTATPSTDQTFTGWTGGTCSGTSTMCTFTIEAATTVKAGFSATYPTTATKVDESYDCTLSVPLGGVDEAATLSVTTQGAPPLQVPPGTTFNMPLFQTVATIPDSVVNTAVADNCTSVSGSVTILDVDATEGATTKTVDAVTGAGTAYQFGPITLVMNTPVVLPLPSSPATIGTFTAGTASPIDFTLGTEATSLAANLSFTCDGISGIPGTLTCTASKPTTPFASTSVQP